MGSHIAIPVKEYDRLVTAAFEAEDRVAYLEDQLKQTQDDLDQLREGLSVEWGHVVERISAAGPKYVFIRTDNEATARAAIRDGRFLAYRYCTPPTVWDETAQGFLVAR